MSKIKRIWPAVGFHAILLPIFFVLDGYIHYHGLTGLETVLIVASKLSLVVLTFFLLGYLISRNAAKSALFATILSSLVFFFGVIKDFFDKTLGWQWLVHYKVFLPLWFVVLCLSGFLILRSKNTRSLNAYLNLLLFVFIVIASLTIIFWQRKPASEAGKSFYTLQPGNLNGKNPDIYFMVFDSYPGTGFLAERMHFDNSSIDTMFRRNGFRVINHARSNYNKTAFSIASTLNFSYISGLNDSLPLNSVDYNAALVKIKTNTVMDMLSSIGYEIRNYSIFELGSARPLRRETFLTATPEEMLMHNTLLQRLKSDIGFHLNSEKDYPTIYRILYGSQREGELKYRLGKRDYNNAAIDSALAATNQLSASPRFIYLHLYLPHWPFFYAENGSPRNPDLILDERNADNRELFLSYLRYTNGVIEKLVERMLHQKNGPPIILYQSDHGTIDLMKNPPDHSFDSSNYAAYYFPDQDYSFLHDSMTNINSFPVILNKYFNAGISPRKDSVFALRDQASKSGIQ